MVGKELFLTGRAGTLVSSETLDEMERNLIIFEAGSIDAKLNFYKENEINDGDIIVEVIVRLRRYSEEE